MTLLGIAALLLDVEGMLRFPAVGFFAFFRLDDFRFEEFQGGGNAVAFDGLFLFKFARHFSPGYCQYPATSAQP